MLAWYVMDEQSRRVGLWLLPGSMRDRTVPRRAYLDSRAVRLLVKDGRMGQLRAWTVDSLVQVAARTRDNAVGRGQGRSLRRGPATEALKLSKHEVLAEHGGTTIRTILESDGLRAQHDLSHRDGEPFVRVHVLLANRGQEDLTLDMASSFSLGGITPFAADDAPGRLRLHRFRSAWGMEGRHVADALEHLHLDRTWAGFNQVAERFGHVGSRPVTTWFPQALVEDSTAGVFWGASLHCEGSWQIELYRQDDTVNLSGGLADRETGQWTRRLAPGETLALPPAVLTTCAGELDEACHRLTAAQAQALQSQPAIERDLPVCFNDFCTFWGHPQHERIVSLAQRLKDAGVTYYVIDEGWACAAQGKSRIQGDWIPDPTRFPEGLAKTCEAIRACGLVPGIWYEWEVCCRPSAVFDEHAQHMLHRDGRPLTVGGRRFWDMRQAESWRQIDQRMLSLLRDLKLGYLKIDYNENIGFGVDGHESPGENLRQHVLATHRYVERLRGELPDLVIENCASGGHRLEPRMQELCAVGSFSDAHETDVIPVVAANLQRLILPRQSMIWATLRAEDDPARLAYSLAATFLGRMCLSGDIDRLDADQWATVRRALELYRRCVGVIRDGVSRRFGPPMGSYEHPRGWQSVRRDLAGAGLALVAAHRFDGSAPDWVCTPLPPGAWRVAGCLTTADSEIEIDPGGLRWRSPHALDGAAMLLMDSSVPKQDIRP